MPVFRTVDDANKGSLKLEAVHQPLYDQNTIGTSAASYSFFGNPAGKNAFQTNLQTAGQLSWPKRFSVRALRQVAAPGSVKFTDYATYLSGSVFKLTVGEKTYLTIPAFLITSGTGLRAQLVTGAAAPLAPANGQTYVNHGHEDQRSLFTLIHSVYIPPVQNFGVTLDVLTGAAPATAFSLHLFLEGELLREIQ
jgi:hypothetical protein